MKKLILFSAILFFAIENFAQSPFLGAKTGVSLTRLKNQQISNNVDSMKANFFTFSYFYGITGGITITERFALQGELLINTLSQNYDITKGTFQGGTSTTEINTVDIPIMVIVGKRIYVEAGPVINIIVNATVKSTVDALNNKDVTDHFDQFSYGVAFGGGLCIHATEHFAVNLGLRGYIGLTDLGNGVDALGRKISEYKTTGWSAGLNGGLRIVF